MKIFCTATGQPARVGVPVPAAFIARLLLGLLLVLPGLARAQTSSFACTGGTQTYTVPAGVTLLQVVATGATNGAVVRATVTVTPGESLTVEVGGTGSLSGPSGGSSGTPYGYNGGGGSGFVGRGGGATDLRRSGPGTGDYLASRNALLVAGGGGGYGYSYAYDIDYPGGSGGAQTGGNGTGSGGYTGFGATPTAAGAAAAGAAAGSANTGGARAGYGGSGGGGYYGGGGGNSSGNNQAAGGGGGGSSWVMPTGSSSISYATSGVFDNGAMTITAVAPSPTAIPAVTAPANSSTVTTATPTYSGTAPAGSTVRLYVDGTLLGTTTTATAGGTYSLAQPTALAQGSHSVAATAQASGQPVSASSATSTFTVVFVPVISSFTPLSGPVGTSVTITGTNLGSASSVRFNGTAQTSFTSNSATQIVLAVPAGATTGTLTVTTAGGTSAASSQTFTVCAAPVALTQNVSVTLDVNGNATVAATAVNNGSTANCGPAGAGTLSLTENTNRLVNGTFDTNATGWTPTNVDGNGGYRSTGGNPGGMFILNDNGNASTDPTLSQTVTGLVSGASYVLRGDYRSNYVVGTLGAPALGVDLNGSQLTTFPAVGAIWTPFGLTFTATGASQTLAFRGEIGGTDVDIVLDNLRLNRGGTTLSYTCANIGANSVTLTVTDAGGNTATAPAVVTVTDTRTPVFAACGAGTPASPFTNLGCAKGVATGTYTFRIGGNTFQGYVDGITDGGGWVQILNYVHQGGTNPALNARAASLPVQTSAALGADESASATAWGHAAPALIAALNPLEVRFYGQTSAHSRVIDFKTSLAAVLSYIKTGNGSMTGIGSAGNFTALPGHTAFLPATTDSYFPNQGAIALTEFPFYKSGSYHWGIQGLGNRWEVDDEIDGYDFSTIHRMFVRGSATAVPGTPVAANVAAGQCGATVTLTGTQAVSDNCAATVTYSPASGSVFAVGTTTVTATATDASGNTTSSSFPVTVTDNIAPALANLLPSAPALALANVPEAAGYGVLYQVDMPANGDFGTLATVPYTVNKSATVLPANPARVAYYVELTNGGTTKWVWASMDNFAANLTQLGLPHPTANPVNWHQSVSNLNVFSNNGGTLVTGSSLGTGRVELWPSNYTQTNTDNVAVANGSYFDMSDGGQNTAAGHGSFQVHNLTTPQTVFGYNGWGSSAAQDGVGIGNQNAPGAGDTDWTFGNNVGIYTVKSLYILVPDASASIQSAAVALSATGTASVSAAQVYRGNATDNCGTVTASVSPNTCTCANVGNNAVVVTLSDSYGNTTTQTTVVTVTVPATPTTTWTGASSTDWTSCANWSYGKVPDAATSVIIPTTMPRYPSLPAGTYPVLSLTVNAGGTLTTVSGATLQVNGNFTNSGTATLNGTVAFVSSAATQTLSNASGFTTLTMNKASGTVQLAQNLTINSALTLSSGTLTTTASYQVNLGGSAAITESETSYVIGKVVVTRTLAPGAAQSFSGLGLTLTPAVGSTAPGATVLTRTTGTALTGAGTSQSILRYFDVVPAVNTGLNVTMDFAYFDHERNGIIVANLRLFKSVSGGTPWILQRGTTAVGNVITKTGITDFSVWTLGNNANPLPVELVTFTATAEGNRAVRLAWATATEKNSQAFEVERSADGIAFDHIGTVAAAGSSSSARSYGLVDVKLPGAALLYYRLKQLDLDGTFAYSPVRSVALVGHAGLSLYPNPARTGAMLTGAAPGTVATVHDALGRQVTTATADAAGTAALVLPAELPAGVYVVRTGVQAVRLVVE